jgi:leucyl-tRNA synthetase
VDPDEMIQAYGADTVRLFCLFAAPPEKDLEWSDQGVDGAYRFLGRIWRLAQENQGSLSAVKPYNGKGGLSRELSGLHRKTHQTIKKVTEDIRDRFHFNTAIAAVMELVNQMYQVLEAKSDSPDFWPVMKEAIEATVLLISPMTPHITEELWQALGHSESIMKASWPEWSEDALQAEEMLIIVQVNGKLRSRITVPSDADNAQIEATALGDARVQDFIAGKPVKKVVVVPNKLVNIVLLWVEG